MKFVPLANRIIVKRDEPKKKVGLLHVPDTAQDKQKTNQGTVYAAGPGRILNDGTLRPLDVSEGDRVLFNAYQGTEIKVNGETLLSIREEDVLAILGVEAQVE